MGELGNQERGSSRGREKRSLDGCVVDLDVEPAAVIEHPGVDELVLGLAVAAAVAFVATGAETYSIGYDYFLMSGDLLGDFADSPFCMGMPFWDYWMPLVALLQAAPAR